MFEQRKPNRKLRLQVNIRKINALISDDYINNDHHLSTNSGAELLPGKICIIDCSEDLKVADQRSIELSAFNFANRAFAYRRLTQGLKLSLSVFSSFMREYLDTLIEADHCAQSVNYKRIVAIDSRELLENIRAVFKCIRNVRSKSITEKCHPVVPKV